MGVSEGNDGSVTESVKIERLIEASDWFVSQAHLKGSSSLESEDHVMDYNNHIRAGLNSLFNVLEQYKSSLSVEQEVMVHYKIASILLRETTSYDIASTYCGRGLQLADRNNMAHYKLMLDILSFEINYLTDKSGNKKACLNYFLSIEQTYDTKNNVELYCFFQYVKIQYFGMTFDGAQVSENFNRMIEMLEPKLDSANFALYQLILICDIQNRLLKGSPIEETFKRHNKLKQSQKQHPDFNSLPSQFAAMTHILDLLLSIQNDDFSDAKSKMGSIDLLIREFKSLDKWAREFVFKITVPMQLGSSSIDLPLQINWLTLREFSMLAYFYCGISYVIKSWDGKNRSEMMFAQCHKYVKLERKEQLRISSVDMEARLLRLKYFSLLVSFYEVLAKFHCNQWNSFNRDEFPQLFEFIDDYNSGQFSSQELLVYHKMVDKVYFLLALQSQRLNNLDDTLQYYLKLRELHSSTANELNDYNFFNDSILASYKQTSTGIGGCLQTAKDFHNQLYYLATLNLAILTIHYLRELKKRDVSEFDDDYQEQMDKYSWFLRLRNVLHDEMAQMRPLYESNVLLKSTLDIMLDFIMADNVHEIEFDLDQLSRLSQISPLLLSMVYFVRAHSFKSDKKKTEPENLDMKVQLYNQSFKASCKQMDSGPNGVGYVALSEISNIIDKNVSHFGKEQQNSAETKLKDLRHGFESRKRKHPDENSRPSSSKDEPLFSSQKK
ncbi:hypothetical protein OGAPHI_004782 [Ogataea philodendri]|uniref:Uncharacterized protein n=1 Tax=Ogataea philodendri TaxID=1378263 RepID=A0A9P8T2Q5_9ASCO|nr:uncharacterized protein OGAPHI_004782 [Ogataea philodendri]KAH3664068.1 hypothetical protein OGAPHI_004782 [Ogataea philodendri]